LTTSISYLMHLLKTKKYILIKNQHLLAILAIVCRKDNYIGQNAI
jgi:hypothetical protein